MAIRAISNPDGSVEEFYDGDNVIESVFHRKTRPDGFVEEKIGNKVNYYKRIYKPDSVRMQSRNVVFCPKCSKIMGGWDSRVYLEYGCCGDCEAKMNRDKPPVGVVIKKEES